MSDYVEITDPDGSRDDWLKLRQTGIGSSDIAGVVGQSNWQSPYSIWWSKVGPVEDTEPTERMQWGTRLEPIIADAWSDHTGIATSRVGMCRNLTRPWQLATPDRLTADGGLLETKNVNAFDYDEWDADTIPLKYLLQTLWQLDCLGLDHGYVAALIGGAELRTFELTPDPELTPILRQFGAEFWQLVESLTAPPTDSADATTAAIKRRWSTPDPEKVAVLDIQWLVELNRREINKADEKTAAQASKSVDNKLREAMGDATAAVCGGLLVAKWEARKDGVRVLNVVPAEKRRELVPS